MIISTSHQFIFVHIFKTAGTSVTECLSRTVRWNDVQVGGTYYGEAIQPAYRAQFGLSKHSTAAQILAVIGPDEWQRRFSFSLVRHPYARAVSVYTWVRKLLRDAPPDDWRWAWPVGRALAETSDFSAFVRHPGFLESQAGQHQVESLRGDDGAMLVDFVGRVEAIDEALGTICQRIGIPYNGTPECNVSAEARARGRVLHAAADYDYIAELYHDDFVAFGYDAELRY